MKRAWAWLWRDGALVRYLFTGVGTSLLDLTLFTVLVSVVSFVPVFANVVSTIITICVSYFLNRAFVFKAERSSFRAFLSFASVTLFTGLVLQSGVIWAGMHLIAGLGWDPTSAAGAAVVKAVAMGVGALCNYIAYSFVFKRPAGEF